MSQPEQTLEWTFQYRYCPDGMHFANRFAGCFVFGLIIIPILLLIALFTGSDLFRVSKAFGDVMDIIRIIMLIVGILLLPFLFFGKRDNQKLRINRQTITLTRNSPFGTIERRMNTSGAKIRAVYFDFWERLFTFNQDKITTAYHIEVFRSGESFLFPCVDEAEQQQILATIKEFGVGDIR